MNVNKPVTVTVHMYCCCVGSLEIENFHIDILHYRYRYTGTYCSTGHENFLSAPSLPFPLPYSGTSNQILYQVLGTKYLTWYQVRYQVFGNFLTKQLGQHAACWHTANIIFKYFELFMATPHPKY